MADHKDCKHYADCDYRNDVGTCPNWCVQYKHKDDVRVVRCKDCKHRDEYGTCTPPIISGYGYDCLSPEDNDFCSYGERKDND